MYRFQETKASKEEVEVSICRLQVLLAMVAEVFLALVMLASTRNSLEEV